MVDALRLNNECFIEKRIIKGGSSGIIYVHREHIRENVKVIIPTCDGELPEIVDKTVGKGVMCGVIYVHKKHLGKMAKIVFPSRLKMDAEG